MKSLTKLFFWEICKIFKNTYFGEHLGTAASEWIKFQASVSFISELFSTSELFVPKPHTETVNPRN